MCLVLHKEMHVQHDSGWPSTDNQPLLPCLSLQVRHTMSARQACCLALLPRPCAPQPLGTLAIALLPMSSSHHSGWMYLTPLVACLVPGETGGDGGQGMFVTTA